MTTPHRDRADSLRSALRGIALGDALGLPYEGLKPSRVARRIGKRPLRPALLPGLLMVSDDTDHAAMALGALRDSGGDAARFEKILAARFRWWFAALPPGVGLATAKAALKLWCGVRPGRAGIRSAGNGPLMRAGILGVALRDDTGARRDRVDRSTRLTHTDERALDAARVFAEACATLARDGRPAVVSVFCQQLAAGATTDEVKQMLAALATPPAEGESLGDYLHTRIFGRTGDRPFSGVSGYAPESLTGALAAFLYGGPDSLAVIRSAILLGGDTDSVASFAGALSGAADPHAFDGPVATSLLRSLRDLPWNAATLDALASGTPPSTLRLALRPLRNLLQLLVVLTHGLLRLTGW